MTCVWVASLNITFLLMNLITILKCFDPCLRPVTFKISPQKNCANVCLQQGSDMNLRAKIKELQHFKGLEISPRRS